MQDTPRHIKGHLTPFDILVNVDHAFLDDHFVVFVLYQFCRGVFSWGIFQFLPASAGKAGKRVTRGLVGVTLLVLCM